MKIWRTIIFILLFMIGLNCSPNFALAVTDSSKQTEIDALNKQIEATKQKIQQMQDTMNQYNKNIDQARSQANSLKNQIGILDNHTAALQTQIDLTREQIKETELQIESLNLSINQKQNTIDKQKEIITSLIQNINAEGQKKYLEILLTNRNFADFFDKFQYLQKTYIELGNSVRALRLAKADLDAKVKQVQDKKDSLLILKGNLDNQKQDLQDQSSAKQNLLIQTQSSEVRYRTLLANLKKQEAETEAELNNAEAQARQKLEAQDKIPAGGPISLSWPVPSHYVTASFHDPDYPFRNVFEHPAIDIRAAQGTPVQAAAPGYIGKATHCTNSSCYNYVLIVHTGNLSTVYGHLNVILVATDQYVNRGDIIGYSGGTPGTKGAGPFVTGPHLHFEVRQNGIPVNPLGFLPQ